MQKMRAKCVVGLDDFMMSSTAEACERSKALLETIALNVQGKSRGRICAGAGHPDE